MKSDHYVLAWKNLKRRGIRSWLTLLGVIIGIIAVVSLISLGDGLKTAINSQFGTGATDVITIQGGGISGYGAPGAGVVNPLTLEDVKAIEKLDGVYMTIGRIVRPTTTEFNDKVQISYATDSPEDNEKRKYFYETNDLVVSEGRLLNPDDINKVVIGSNYANADKSGFGKEISSGESIIINGKSFRVVGVLKKTGSFIWDGIFLINDNQLRDLVDAGEEVDLIAVRVQDKNEIENIKLEIEKLMRDRRDVDVGKEDFEVSTPEAMLKTVNQIIGGVQIFIVLIAFISIFVGSIGIINTMTTSVMERTKEIGIMKAIGAKNSDIFFQFFIEAGLLGFVGGVIGVLIGLCIGALGMQAINNFTGAGSSLGINFTLIFGTLAGSFLIGSVAGIAPAMKAAKLNPVEALRK